jgi:hypothetical protein
MNLYDLSKKAFKRPDNTGETDFQGLEIDITDTITISGQKGSGKSFFATNLAESFPNVVFFDPRWERFTKGDKRAESTKAIQLSNKWITADEPQGLKEKLMQGKTHIIYHPQPLRMGVRMHKDMVDEFNQISQIIYDYGGITFFVDEADNVCDQWNIGEGFRNLMEYGKHRNVGTICITRRLQHLNTRIPRLSSLLIFFRLSAKDFKYISEFLIEPGDDETGEPEQEDGEEQEHYEERVITKNQWFENIRKEITHLPDRFFYIFDGKKMQKYNPIAALLLPP